MLSVLNLRSFSRLQCASRYATMLAVCHTVIPEKKKVCIDLSRARACAVR